MKTYTLAYYAIFKLTSKLQKFYLLKYIHLHSGYYNFFF